VRIPIGHEAELPVERDAFGRRDEADGRAAPSLRPLDGRTRHGASQPLPLPGRVDDHEPEPGERPELHGPAERDQRPGVLERKPSLGLQLQIAPQARLARLSAERRGGESGSRDDVVQREAAELHPWGT